ncbi:chalcone isomerase family protein [Vibrio sp. AND4]|uniref:chalcone isomerase family protein n=1 Tax=Vibrio sp. AND4 TaxID=314289 RepID=UPI00015F0EAA|nr:chalcone isomerase family protein [Vibrio sp. AND4]EDP58906.1 hypothetical protein AND4_03029 [Vibrio sp. AND4]
MKSLKRSWKRKLTGNMLINGVMVVFGICAMPLQAQNVVGSSQTMTTNRTIITSNWQQWQTVGEAQLTWFIFDIYKSRLKAPEGRYLVTADVSPHPFALEINYQRDISKKQLLEVTDEQWQKLGFTEPYRQQWISELDTMFPDIKKGDELTYLTDGKNGQLIYSQAGISNETQKIVGHVKDERLNDAFLSIWLSPQTEFPKLRAKLIGQVRQ